jgi:hypothetical protein
MEEKDSLHVIFLRFGLRLNASGNSRDEKQQQQPATGNCSTRDALSRGLSPGRPEKEGDMERLGCFNGELPIHNLRVPTQPGHYVSSCQSC